MIANDLEPIEREVRVEKDVAEPLKRETIDVLTRLREITGQLSTTFSALACDPSSYALAREDVERLEAERRTLIGRLGELASRFLIVTDATRQTTKDPDEDTHVSSPAPSQQEISVPSSAAPVSQSELASFRATFGETEPKKPAAPKDDKSLLASLADHVEIASKTPDFVGLQEEIDAFETATSAARVALWKRLTPQGQVRWLEVLVAWAKALEQEAMAVGSTGERVRDGFGRLRAYSKDQNPGYIHGFARDAAPKSASWRASAVEKLELVTGAAKPLAAEPKKKSKSKDEDDDDDDTDSARSLEGWPFLDRVKKKMAVMLGGDIREERRVAIERAFQLAELDWVPHDSPRRLQNLSERAANGSIDFVLVNKFVAHKETMALQKVSKAPLIVLRHGYGISAIRTALEEHFARRANEA